MAAVSAGRIVLAVYHSLATVVAVALMAQFFRKRHEFFLKVREREETHTLKVREGGRVTREISKARDKRRKRNRGTQTGRQSKREGEV